MPELRKDPVTGRWVIISTDRQKRPNDFMLAPASVIGAPHCPFCPGHEEMTPPEVLAYREGGERNGPGWSVRVVPNKYPALVVEGTLDREGEGMFDRMTGIGAHEVIIDHPVHDRTWATMGVPEIVQVLWACRERMLDLQRDTRLRYVLVFKNHGGAAGATLEHTHTQLVALPFVPDLVRQELAGAREHFRTKERCVFCDIVRQEVASGRRVVELHPDVVALSPYAPRVPFETWLLPRRHEARFEQASRDTYHALATVLQGVLRRMDAVLERPAFNLVVHSMPFGEGDDAQFHWHVEVLPRLTRSAGFESGTGVCINPTAPEEATDVLRAANI